MSADEPAPILHKKRPIVMTGPSGVGKGTLIEMLRKRYPGTFSFCVSHTTRKPRPGEQNGVNYHFTSKEAMQQQIDAGEFVEWARVHDNLYGTSKASIHAAMAHGIPLLDIDVQGARAINAIGEFRALFIFIKPPSIDDLKQRLVARSTESPEVIEKRVRNAIVEIEASAEPFWSTVLVNDVLDDCFAKLCAFIEHELAGGAALRSSVPLLLSEQAAAATAAATAAAHSTTTTDPKQIVVPNAVHHHA